MAQGPPSRTAQDDHLDDVLEIARISHGAVHTAPGVVQESRSGGSSIVRAFLRPLLSLKLFRNSGIPEEPGKSSAAVSWSAAETGKMMTDILVATVLEMAREERRPLPHARVAGACEFVRSLQDAINIRNSDDPANIFICGMRWRECDHRFQVEVINKCPNDSRPPYLYACIQHGNRFEEPFGWIWAIVRSECRGAAIFDFSAPGDSIPPHSMRNVCAVLESSEPLFTHSPDWHCEWDNFKPHLISYDRDGYITLTLTMTQDLHELARSRSGADTFRQSASTDQLELRRTASAPASAAAPPGSRPAWKI